VGQYDPLGCSSGPRSVHHDGRVLGGGVAKPNVLTGVALKRKAVSLQSFQLKCVEKQNEAAYCCKIGPISS
jgi:hypothetical protein